MMMILTHYVLLKHKNNNQHIYKRFILFMIIIPEVITFNVYYFIIFTIKLIFNDFGFGLTDIFESDE